MPQHPFELRIGIDDDDPEGYESHDACPDLMEEFFRQLGIPVAEQFICLSIRSADEVNKLQNRRWVDNSVAALYGRQYALRPEYLDKVEIVCAGDCLKIMERAVVVYIKDKVPLAESANKITLLRGMQPDERAKAIWQAHLLKGANAKYSEARIYEPFKSEWFIECDGTDESKQEEADEDEIEL
jgi:hypothetical protein